MTVWFIDFSTMRLKSETYDVANLNAFSYEMDSLHPDGWFDNYEDAEEELRMSLEG